MTPSLVQREAAVSAYLLYDAAESSAWVAITNSGATDEEIKALCQAKDEAWAAFEALGVDLVFSGHLPARCERTGVPIVSSDDLDDGESWALCMEVA